MKFKFSAIFAITAIISALAITGCVERKVTIRTEPSGATLLLDSAPAGQTPYTFPFIHYGVREIIIKKDGYVTVKEDIDVSPPLYQRFPIDLFFEALPFTITDQQEFVYNLTPVSEIDEKELLERAKVLRSELELTNPKPEVPPKQ
ncbi:MAG: PEGA domain-containing protein [Planctomycetes bacterium]|nr:PEGA domain-containing protein [Planctomycetota bacterium]